MRAANAGNLAEQAAHNTTFHRVIMEASGNTVLLRLWDSLAFETHTRLNLSRRTTDSVKDAKSHRPIVEAFERGDGRTAGRLLREHAEAVAPTDADAVD